MIVSNSPLTTIPSPMGILIKPNWLVVYDCFSEYETAPKEDQYKMEILTDTPWFVIRAPELLRATA